ncbi:MAG: hypothetical protein LBK82_17185 [Planctomycetaceae bacterium]|jgi:hypothetical protein|nr:hypothetical protein [Planctomycetaceae bacterium]
MATQIAVMNPVHSRRVRRRNLLAKGCLPLKKDCLPDNCLLRTRGLVPRNRGLVPKPSKIVNFLLR